MTHDEHSELIIMNCITVKFIYVVGNFMPAYNAHNTSFFLLRNKQLVISLYRKERHMSLTSASVTAPKWWPPSHAKSVSQYHPKHADIQILNTYTHMTIFKHSD
jgi:hypothetical protein